MEDLLGAAGRWGRSEEEEEGEKEEEEEEVDRKESPFGDEKVRRLLQAGRKEGNDERKPHPALKAR